MFSAIKNLFKKKEPTDEQLVHHQDESYAISDEELEWVVDKIIYNKRRYDVYFALVNNGALANWKELAVLHYILFRLNFTKLQAVKPSALNNYSEHYYFKAGMKVLKELNEI